eukprot:858310-Prorocentrum_minimum.AAC.1
MGIHLPRAVNYHHANGYPSHGNFLPPGTKNRPTGAVNYHHANGYPSHGNFLPPGTKNPPARGCELPR